MPILNFQYTLKICASASFKDGQLLGQNEESVNLYFGFVFFDVLELCEILMS